MWIERDFLNNFDIKTALESVLIRGPRQIGKSAILNQLKPPAAEIYLDDATLRIQANENPDLLLAETVLPLLIDEVQLAPPLFSAIKKKIDEFRRLRLKENKPTIPGSFRLTGSNQFLLDRNVKESLAGRVSQFYLLGLSYHELQQYKSDVAIADILLRGGFPELWIRPEINVLQYLNDYISSFIEKDIARVAGVQKMNDFLKVLKLLAARTGELLNYESIASDSGVVGVTVKEWVNLLAQNQIIYVLPVYSNNLNKRLIKMPKVFFPDLGLCVRLQGHTSTESLLFTTLGGHLFETLVVSEVVKTQLNYQKNWQLSYWRTKDKEEIDLVIESSEKLILIEIKLNIAGAKDLPKIPETLKKTNKSIDCIVVHAGQNNLRLNSDWTACSLRELHDILLKI